MKQMTKMLFFLTVMGLISCSSKITSNFTNSQPKLSIDEPIALLDIEHKLPERVTKIGDLRFQDSGFSTDCSFNSLLNQGSLEARKNGANIVKVIEKKTPDIWSSCYRLKIEFYAYDGDVSTVISV